MLTKFNQHILLRLTFYSYKCIIPTNTDTICRVFNIIAFAQEGHESARENHYYFKEKAMRNPNSLVYKTRRYGLFRFLLDLEYKAFGYRRAGGTTETVDDGYEVTSTDTHVNVNHKTHIVRYAHYMRHYKYPTNFLFSLIAFIDRVLSSIRVILSSLIIIAALVCFIGEVPAILYIYAAVYGLNILTMLLGFIIRKAFRLDEKMDELCDKNNWKRYSEYYDE